MDNKKILVVYNKFTKKLIPFTLGDFGDVILEYTENNEDDLIVSMKNVGNINFDTGYILED